MSQRLNLIVLGKQGAGKGTQSTVLAEKYGVPHVSTGDILRNAVAAGSELGKQVESILHAGDLVSDDLVNQLIRERFKEADAQKGVVLDGFPRTIGQAEALEEMLATTASNSASISTSRRSW
jgi:adenylate kinase